MNRQFMIDIKTIYRTLLASVFALMLVGCAGEDIELGEKQTLEMIPFCSSFVSPDMPSDAKTRALPDNYVRYSEMSTAPDDKYAKIRAYVATKSSGEWQEDHSGMFYHTSGDAWASTVKVDPETQYYIYGFMPAESANGSITSTNYAQGATLTLSNLSTIVPADVCAVVGVMKGPTEENAETDIEAITETVTPGQFGYYSSEDGKKNTIYILLDHLYSCVNLKFAVDSTYDALRTIKLTKVEMQTKSGAATVTAVVTLTQGNATNPMSKTITPDGSDSGTTAEILSETKQLTKSYCDVPGYFTPGVSPLQFDVVTTYNVYDTSDNLVRENCKATNAIKIEDSSAAGGKIYTVKLLVQPTYLYQLSNPDLDNPTIVVSSSN